MADEDPPNGRYASFREFADFREEARAQIKALEQRAEGIERSFKLEVASALKSMTRQMEAMEQRQQAEQAAALVASRFKLSTFVQAYGPILTGGIAIAIAILKP